MTPVNQPILYKLLMIDQIKNTLFRSIQRKNSHFRSRLNRPSYELPGMKLKEDVYNHIQAYNCNSIHYEFISKYKMCKTIPTFNSTTEV